MAQKAEQFKGDVHFLSKIVSPVITSLLIVAVLALFKMSNEVSLVTQRVDQLVRMIEKNEPFQKQAVINAQRLDELERRLQRLESRQ